MPGYEPTNPQEKLPILILIEVSIGPARIYSLPDFPAALWLWGPDLEERQVTSSARMGLDRATDSFVPQSRETPPPRWPWLLPLAKKKSAFVASNFPPPPFPGPLAQIPSLAWELPYAGVQPKKKKKIQTFNWKFHFLASTLETILICAKRHLFQLVFFTVTKMERSLNALKIIYTMK